MGYQIRSGRICGLYTKIGFGVISGGEILVEELLPLLVRFASLIVSETGQYPSEFVLGRHASWREQISCPLHP